MTKPEKKALVPALRFPEFRDGGEWTTEVLDNLIDVIDGDRGTNYPKAEEFSQSGFCLFLNAKNVTKDGFKFEELQFITEEKDGALRKGKLQRNDIVLTTRGSVGQFACFVEGIPYENMRINSGMVILRVKSRKIISDYLYAYSKSALLAMYIENIAFGNAQQQLTVAVIKKIPIYYPLPDEQQKIADCLSSLDDLISAETQKLAALKAHKKGLMQQLFPAEGETVPKLRFPEFRDEGEWEEKRLIELTTKISDGIHTTPIYDEDGQYFFINGNNLANGRVVIDEKTKKVGFAEFNKHKKPIDENSILMSINGTIGNLAFFRNERVILGKSSCFINIDQYVANKYFIYYILQTDRVISAFASELTSSTIKNLSLGAIKNLEILFPLLPEQQKIADCLSSIDELINAQSQKIEALKSHKKGLMQQLFPSMDEDNHPPPAAYPSRGGELRDEPFPSSGGVDSEAGRGGSPPTTGRGD